MCNVLIPFLGGEGYAFRLLIKLQILTRFAIIPTQKKFRKVVGQMSKFVAIDLTSFR